MRQRRLLLVLRAAMAAQACAMLPSASADISDGGKTRTTLDWFAPTAPTVTVEDIEEHMARRERLQEERARESARRDRESERMTQACFDAPAAAQPVTVPATPGSVQPPPALARSAGAAAPAGKAEPTLEELMRRYQETRDPADAAAIQLRLLPAGAKPLAPVPSATDTLARLGTLPGIDPRMAEQMRRAGRGTDPKVQACLADAERHGEKTDPELPIDFLSPGLDKLQFLKEGRAASLVFDKVSGTEIAHYRINVVLRGGSRGPLAVPMATAMERAYVQGAAPNPPAEALARDNAILSNPGPSAARQKSNAGSLGGIGEAAGRLQDALKGLPR